MSRKTISQKAARTITLLLGLRRPEIAAYLKPYGLDNETLREGWRLFTAATEYRVNATDTQDRSPTLINELDAFENEWFPVAKLVLARSYPEETEQLFLNLNRADGKDVSYTVDYFIRRLSAMERGEAPFEARGPEVRAFLKDRGLSDQIVSEAQALLADLKAMSDVPARPDTSAAQAEAEAAMWDWYLEWGGLSRHAIKDGRLLRVLGFKKRSVTRTAEFEDEETPSTELIIEGEVTSPADAAASQISGVDTPALPERASTSETDGSNDEEVAAE